MSIAVAGVCGNGRCLEVQNEIAAEADPRKEEHEYGNQYRRSAAIVRLLFEEVGVAHRYDFIDRSTLGTSRSFSSVISHSSTIAALARPAIMFHGNCCCFTL